MSKEQKINKILKDLPIKELRSKMSDKEWYGWFEECWDKAIDFSRCCVELKGKKAIEYLEEQSFGYDHFTQLTSTGINPDNDNIAQFAEDYHQSKLSLLTTLVVVL